MSGHAGAKWFGAGYQDALRDILNKLNEGGEAAAREWIENNLIKEQDSDNA